ncbi:MAG: amidase [Proteobacteria bacterium]|nr:amidase [Pseudomonadota bacterium]
MELKDYYKEDALGLAKLIKTKQISPLEALDCARQRMLEVNPKLNAIIADRTEWGLKKLDKMTGEEPFYGVPILIKDLGFTMEGLPYSAGSHFYQGTAPNDSDLVKRLLQLGFVPFAQTNTPELGLSYVTESNRFGACHNPYDLTRTPGGSSGGSAAAVAAGIAPVATANDAGGSIRIPAACCGLFGFKPTPGQLSTGPHAAEAFSGLATAHVLTRTVRDSAFLFDLLKAPTLKEALTLKQPDRALAKGPKRISLIEGIFADVPVAKPYLIAVEKTVKILENLGYSIESHSLELDLKSIAESALILIYANLNAEIDSQEERFGKPLQEGQLEPINMQFLKLGKNISASQLIRARNKIFQLTRPLQQLLEEVDILLTPSLAKLPLKIGGLPFTDNLPDFLRKNVEFCPFTSIFNQATLPAMVMPVMHYDNLPISVQFAAGKNRDHFLLDFAKELEPHFPDFSQPLIKIA